MRALQLAAKRSGEAEDMAVKPPTYGPPSIDRVSMLPGSHTASRRRHERRHQAGLRNPAGALEMLDAKIERLHRAIDAMTFADLFMAITNMERGAAAQRRGAAPPPRGADDAARAGDRPRQQRIPAGRVRPHVRDHVAGRDAAASAARNQGMEIKVDFVSVLAQAQKLLGISQTERSVAFVGNVAAAFPEAPTTSTSTRSSHDYWDRTGAPASGLRDPKVRDHAGRLASSSSRPSAWPR
jgi:hypothetical protein